MTKAMLLYLASLSGMTRKEAMLETPGMVFDCIEVRQKISGTKPSKGKFD
ncbi:hypothetical protein AALG83_02250 [Christensenellaceae bacterium 44-20]